MAFDWGVLILGCMLGALIYDFLSDKVIIKHLAKSIKDNKEVKNDDIKKDK